MLFEDDEGRLLMPEEVDELSPWEIDERRLHIYEERSENVEELPVLELDEPELQADEEMLEEIEEQPSWKADERKRHMCKEKFFYEL